MTTANKQREVSDDGASLYLFASPVSGVSNLRNFLEPPVVGY